MPIQGVSQATGFAGGSLAQQVPSTYPQSITEPSVYPTPPPNNYIAWDDMTNIEKFNHLLDRLIQVDNSMSTKLYELRNDLINHSHDSSGRPCKPISF